MKIKQTLMLTTDNLSFSSDVFWPQFIDVSKVLENSNLDENYRLKYKNLTDALIDGWEITSAPVQTGTAPNHLYYTWILVKND